jgi:hypothetical protein
MSGTTTLCPVDPSTPRVPEVLVTSGEAFYALPDPPDPAPGDPGVPRPTVSPRAFGRRVQVLACKPVFHTPLAELRTARVESWSDRFGPSDAEFSIDTHDPGLRAFPARSTTVRGRSVVVPDLKGIEVTIGLEGARTWTGIIQEPTGWGQGRMTVRAVSPEALFDERTLGETEQHDYYDGRGAFPTTSLAGWSFDPNVTHEFETDHPYEGERSLRVEAVGVGGSVYGPWALMKGQDGITRYPRGSALVKAPYHTPVWVSTEVRLLDGTVVNKDFTKANLGASDDGNTGWQGPVAGRGRLTPEAVDHNVRVRIYLTRGQSILLDLIRLQWPTLTGFPNDTDLSYYPGRIIRDAQASQFGGSSWGMASVVDSLTGVEDRITFPHQEDHPVGEAISTITDMAGGPDVRVTPAWRLKATARRGQDRTDIALTPDRIISCTMTIDPGGQIDELRGLTDIGSGSDRHVFGVNGPVHGTTRRIRKLVPVPNGLNYDAARRWTEGQAEYAARTPFSAEVTVDFDFGLRFAVGDGVRFAYDDGNLAWWGPVRVGARTMKPRSNTCVLEVGTDPVVAL